MPLSANESSTVFFSVFNNSLDAVVLSRSGSRELTANAAACQLLGYTPDEFRRISLNDLVDMEDRQVELFKSERERCGAAQGALGIIRKDGTRFQALLMAATFTVEDGETCMTWTLRNVSAQQALEQHLQESRARYEALINAMEEGVIVQDADNNIFACNQSTERILGFSEAQIKVRNEIGSAWNPCREDGTPLAMEELPSVIAMRTGQPVRNFPVRVARSDGEHIWIRISSVPLFKEGDLRPYLVVTSFVDITGLKQQQHELVSQACTDALTGIANRRVLAVKGEEAFNAAVAGAQLAVLAIDIDHFKAVNDKFGHAVGDDVLKIIATRLRDYTRDTDLVVRTGGEEFCVLLPHTSNDKAVAIGERIREAIASAPLLQVGQESLTVTLSLGLVSYRQGVDESLTSLLTRGDNALYQAKHSGRNRLVALS